MRLHTVLVRKVEMQLDGGSAVSSTNLGQRALENRRINEEAVAEPESHRKPRHAGRALRMFCTLAFLFLLVTMTSYIHKLYRDLETQVKIGRRKGTV